MVNRPLVIAIFILWVLIAPLFILAIGFAGNKFWSIFAIVEELKRGYYIGLIARIFISTYFIAPPCYIFLKLRNS